MRTYVAFFEYWTSNSPDTVGEESNPAGDDEIRTGSARWYRADPHWLTLTACATNEEEALGKFRECLLKLYHGDSRQQMLPSGAQVTLSSLFDLTDLSDEAAILDWSTIRVEQREEAMFRAIMRMPSRSARKLARPNPTETPITPDRKRVAPFVTFPDLH